MKLDEIRVAQNVTFFLLYFHFNSRVADILHAFNLLKNIFCNNWIEKIVYLISAKNVQNVPKKAKKYRNFKPTKLKKQLSLE